MTPLVLTVEQIKALADFAEQDGQPAYTISQASIPKFEADDGSTVLVAKALSPTQNQKNTSYFNWKIKHYSDH
ncbi:TPA: hypothetical protein ACXP3C_004812 [Klebsiella pneumoniae]|uniref:hypothetical protein n=1 Tax=Klebsiella pneumoniae TaxID=573 RepID=UPI0039750520